MKQDIKPESVKDLACFIQMGVPCNQGQEPTNDKVCEDPCHLFDDDSSGSESDNAEYVDDHRRFSGGMSPRNAAHKKCTRRMATLEEVMNDSDFLDELSQENQVLLNYLLQKDRILQMIEYVIHDANFRDSPARCFQLPFITCEAFCIP